MSQLRVQTKNFSARFDRSIVLYPYFHSNGAVSDCDGYLSTVTCNYCPPKKFLVAPNQRSLATCLYRCLLHSVVLANSMR